MFGTQAKTRNTTSLYFVFLNFLIVCQNIYACLKLNGPRLAIVYCYIRTLYSQFSSEQGPANTSILSMEHFGAIYLCCSFGISDVSHFYLTFLNSCTLQQFSASYVRPKFCTFIPCLSLYLEISTYLCNLSDIVYTF